MNTSLPFAIFAVLFGPLAQLPTDTPVSPMAFLERYGFPVLVSVVLWLRLERNQKDDRADRLSSDQARLDTLKSIKDLVENGQTAHFELAVKAVESTTSHAAAVAALTEKLHRYQVCPMVQLELFKGVDSLKGKP